MVNQNIFRNVTRLGWQERGLLSSAPNRMTLQACTDGMERERAVIGGQLLDGLDYLTNGFNTQDSSPDDLSAWIFFLKKNSSCRSK